MQLTRKHHSRHTIVQESKTLPINPDVGLVLLDSSLKPLAFDHGAASILNQPNPLTIPEEILRDLRRHKPAELASIRVIVRRGNNEYVCRAHFVEGPGGFGPSYVALHFERGFSTMNAMYQAAVKYSLTEREQETLQGLSMGLSNKQLSEKMNISPNTVRAFLRLIMVKMGVTSRSAIVAKILHERSNVDRVVGLPSEHEVAV